MVQARLPLSPRPHALRPVANAWRRLCRRLQPWLLCTLITQAAAASDCAPPTPLRLEAEALQRQHTAMAAGPQRARLALSLGQAWLRLGQPARADALLDEAGTGLDEPQARAQARVEQGNARWTRRDAAGAEAAWAQALALAPGDAEVALAVELNRLRDLRAPQRLARLQLLAARLPTAGAGQAEERAAVLWLNLGARAVEQEPAGWPLAQQAFEQAHAAAQAASRPERAAEALDALADLQERRGQRDEALSTSLRVLAMLQTSAYRDLAIGTEARIGRLSLAQGDEPRAVAAFLRAVSHIEAVRADIPVYYEDGRSSFRETLEPVYLGLTDALLTQAAKAPRDERQALLRAARSAVEISKQSEMEDYLLDRCSLRAAKRAKPFTPPAGTAVLYPVMLPERLELLLETASGIERFPVDVTSERLRSSVQRFVESMRSRGPVRAQAERLYRQIIAPLRPALEAQGIDTLVWVPDGVLRLLPLGALHDGRDYLIRRYDLATVPAMQVLGAGGRVPGRTQVLLAGVSEPGPAVSSLTPGMVASIGIDLGPSRGLAGKAAAAALAQADVQATLRQALALPGVKLEVEAIARQTQGRALINRDFTVDGLRDGLLNANPSVLHIASHGFFGDSADTTFLMAFDRLITLDALQDMLRSAQLRRPLDLITLSACQTAEGDDRAPLGLSGAAIKARAKSAMGTLWPVSDNAAQTVMTDFYRRLSTGTGKAAALRQAQAALLANPDFEHPFFWAPFTLVGDWQ